MFPTLHAVIFHLQDTLTTDSLLFLSSYIIRMNEQDACRYASPSYLHAYMQYRLCFMEIFNLINRVFTTYFYTNLQFCTLYDGHHHGRAILTFSVSIYVEVATRPIQYIVFPASFPLELNLHTPSNLRL